MNRKAALLLCLILGLQLRLCAQDGPGRKAAPLNSSMEDAADEVLSLEGLAERNESDITDDAREIDLNRLKKNPLNLNRAGAEDLTVLPGITPSRISSLLLYRKELGLLISLHELQAVPGWDPDFIRNLLPYVFVGKDESLAGAVRERWFRGDDALLLRSAAALEKSAGYRNDSTGYEGSPMKIFLRYSYNFKQLLQYGFSGEKDPGEPFFRRGRRDGFDFYSFHFFLRESGIVKALAIGDFTVNLGQGLIGWQTIAFAKGGGVAAIKRQAPVLKPYHSAGEYNFHRGAGITLAKGRWEATLFFSRQAIGTHPDADTLTGEDLFTSFQNGGYHRTAAEIATRNNNRQLSAGGNLTWRSARFEAGLNLVWYRFSARFAPRAEPYNLFAFRGNRFSAQSFHYGYSLRNWYLFGEAAMDQAGHGALVQGLAGSIARNLDIGFIYRNISPRYQSLYADAFTENSHPVNEKGLYSILSFTPLPSWKLEMYYDLFEFPWLRYRDDAPGYGREWSFRSSWQPVKNWIFQLGYRSKTSPLDQSAAVNGVHFIKYPEKQRFRVEFAYQFSRKFTLKWRSESVWIRNDPDNSGTNGQGYSSFLEIFYHNIIMSGNCRIQRFSLPGYDFRTYMYESDMLYSFALPAYYNSGWSYYFNLSRKIFSVRGGKKSLKIWARWAQTVYAAKLLTGSGLDEVNARTRSRWGAQLMYSW